MSIELRWMPAQAPYAPVSIVGLLALLEASGSLARAHWHGSRRQVLTIETSLDIGAVADLIAGVERPALERIAWPNGTHEQALKPTLKDATQPARAFREMAKAAAEPEARLLRAIVTDAVLDNDAIPSRSRLLRGVKADLSSASASPKGIDRDGLSRELEDGPRFVGRESGLGLGLIPEVQTFGGTTGPDASTVGAYSPLLYMLLWQGLLALPPIAVSRGRQRLVGGPLVTTNDVLSWPRWNVPVGLNGLRSLLGWREIHEEHPDLQRLRARGIDAVYRARAVPLSTMVAVYRWGEQVAG